MGRRLIVLLIVATAAATTTGAEPTRAASPTIGWKWLGTTCVPAAGGTVRARLRVRMIVHNSDTPRTWAQGMKVSVRLEPLSAGTNITRSWRTQRKDGLVQNKRYTYDFTVLTDTVKPTADWRLHTKLIWDRVAPIPDIVNDFKSPTALPCIGGISSASP